MTRVRLDLFNSKKGLDRGASKIKEIIWYFFKVVFFMTSVPYPNGLKKQILILFGAKIGNNVIIKPRVNIHMPWKLIINSNVWIGEEVFILNFEKIEIGNNVCISQRAFLCGGNHDFTKPEMPYRNGQIILKDGCWVGANCFIGPGVVVGSDSVITAGSILTNEVEENGIYRGNPAKFIKKRWK